MKNSNEKEYKENFFNFIKSNKSELPKDYKFNREELYEKSPLKQDKKIDNEKADKL